MFSPLVQNMIEQYGYPVLTQETLDDFLDKNEVAVLFFTENAKKFPETDDVAMILPELVKAFEGQLSAAVIAMPDQRKLQAHYGFSEWPTLVFLRNGGYLGAISRVQDWQVYLGEIQRLLASEPGRPPGFKVRVVTASSCP